MCTVAGSGVSAVSPSRRAGMGGRLLAPLLFARVGQGRSPSVGWQSLELCWSQQSPRACAHRGVSHPFPSAGACSGLFSCCGGAVGRSVHGRVERFKEPRPAFTRVRAGCLPVPSHARSPPQLGEWRASHCSHLKDTYRSMGSTYVTSLRIASAYAAISSCFLFDGLPKGEDCILAHRFRTFRT